MNKIVIFGEAPGPNTDPRRPLYPHESTGAAAKLASLMGVENEWLVANTDRYNTFHDGEKTLGLTQARSRVVEIIPLVEDSHEHARFVILGAKALSCMPAELRKMDPLETWGAFLFVPHTSGANLWYNSAQNRMNAAIALQTHLRGLTAAPARQTPWLPAAGTGPGFTGRTLRDATMAIRSALHVGPLPPPPHRDAVEIEWLVQRWLAEGADPEHKIARRLAKQESLRAVPVVTEMLRVGAYPDGPLLDLLRLLSGHEPWLQADRADNSKRRAAWIHWYDRMTPATEEALA